MTSKSIVFEKKTIKNSEKFQTKLLYLKKLNVFEPQIEKSGTKIHPDSTKI